MKSINMTARVSLALLILLIGLNLTSGQLNAQQSSHTFTQTGHTVKGRFLQYWNEHGGLIQLGYPLTDEFQEVSPLNGKSYQVQYFERAVFELHPENQQPYDVLLSQLGRFQYQAKYPNGAPGQVVNGQYAYKFAETGHTIGGRFHAYWETHGGLAQQGYPLSDEFMEVSPLNGKPYLVQYFERAVFEYHAENQVPNDVLLSQLGTFQLKAKYPNGVPATQLATLNAVQMGSTETGYAVGSGGSLFHFANGTWQQDASLTQHNLNGLHITAKGLGYAVGDAGTILSFSDSTGSGYPWAAVASPTTANLHDVDQGDLGEYWAVGDGVILHNFNGKWTVQTAPDNAILYGIDMLNADEGWAVGYVQQAGKPAQTAILHYSNSQWQRVNAPAAGVLNDVQMPSASEGWAVGNGGVILRYQNATWTQVGSPSNLTLQSVKVVNDEGWAVGGDLLHYKNGRWSKYTNPVAPAGMMNDVALLSTDNGQEAWAVGESGIQAKPGAILHYQSGNWSLYSSQ